MTRLLPACLLAATAALATHAADDSPPARWAHWRGPTGNGAALAGSPPAEWSESRNVAWKRELPGRGLASPVVWDGRVFVSTAVQVGDAVKPGSIEPEGAHDNLAPTRELAFRVLALDATTGDMLWQTTVRRQRPHEGTHVTGSWASPSPATDGKRLYASFGSAGIHALDLDGKLLWSVDLGDMQTRHGHGEGSSPALWGDTLIVNWDHQGGSFLAALDTADGKQRWRVARDEITSWSTPLIVEHAGRRQVIVAATKRIRAYDLADGRLIWECGGLSRNVVASPVHADGIVYAGNSYDGRALLAIRLEGAQGDITDTGAVVWRRDRDTPYVPSPVLSGNRLCFVKHLHAIFTCVDKNTGETLFGPQRLGGLRDIFASPVAAGGKIYIPSRNGATLVIEDGPVFRSLALNRLDDSFSATPAPAGDALYMRGERYLYKIAAPAPREPAGQTAAPRKPARGFAGSPRR